MIAQWIFFTKEELRKQFYGGKLKALLLLAFFIGFLFVIMSERIGMGGNLPVISLELMLTFVFPLFMAMLGSDLMISEFQDGTIKNALKLPLSREALFMGKILAGWIAGALVVLSAFMPVLIGSVVFKGIPAPSMLGAAMAELAGAILFCGLLVVLANGVSLWTGSGRVGLLISVVLWLTMGIIGLFEPQWSRFFVTDFADWIQPMLYSGHVAATVTTLLFMIAYYIIGTILGLLAFQRKEI